MIRMVAVATALLTISITKASAMGLSFSWGPTKKCFDPKSPPMTVTSVPNGTVKLKFRMVDLNKPSYPHGGGSVTYKGSGSIPYGAFRYKGPCPPSPHTYEFTVKAVDSSGKTLATARARKRFP